MLLLVIQGSIQMIIWSIIGVIFILYGIALRLVGVGTRFYLIWPVIGGVCLGIAAALHFDIWSKLPILVKRLTILLVALSIGVGVLVEGIIFSAFNTKGKDNLDYIIVLGAQVYEHGPSRVLKYRLDRAVEYLDENPDTKCIVSGGKGYNEPFAEAYGMKKYLVENGVDENRIVLEDKSENTVQNIQYSIKLIDADNMSVGILTNNFHMFRGLNIAKKQGIKNVCGVPAKSSITYLPNNMLREGFGVIKDFIKGNL